MTFRNDFTYTASKTDFNSSAVEEAYYHVDAKELVVVVTGGGAYLYKNVLASVWYDFVHALSAGRYYAINIKPFYGPGEYLGYVEEEDEFFVNAFDEPDEVETGDELLDSSAMFNKDNVVTHPQWVLTPPPTTVNVFNESSSTVNESSTFSLATPEPEVTKRKHILKFKVNGQLTEREYTLQAVNLEDAIEQLRNIADMLDLVFEVTSATVVFSE